jgi:halogenation protein CepH
LLAGDAACFNDPVFSTGVHLACLSGYLAARTLTNVLEGDAPSEQFPLYDRRYRALFERYLNFLCFFYDHHGDAGSYFWQARKLLGEGAPEYAQIAFTRLVSGAADFDAERSWTEELADRRERVARATAHGRLSAMPDAAIFRANTTVKELKTGR